MKLFSWNVNGIRAASSKGFLDWFSREKADVVCVQEIKAFPEQVDLFLRNPGGYEAFWNPAEKPGYSGVATFSKKEPKDVIVGIGVEEIDREGRVLTTDHGDFVLVNAYFPNSQREHARLPYKHKFCFEMMKYLQKWRKKGRSVVLCGDYNIAHTEIDLANPKTNQDNAGFLPEERAWMTEFLSNGWVDVFRTFEKGPGHYTWWSHRPGVRDRNIGWRLDYHCVNEEFTERVKRSFHQPKVLGSDHCPVGLELKR